MKNLSFTFINKESKEDDNEENKKPTVGGGARTIDGVISTRRGNASNWMSMIGTPPAGEWKLELPNTRLAALR